VAALVVALGWWLLVLKWEWYCFAWHSWADPTLHDARACQALGLPGPFLERGRLLTAAYGFRSVYEGRLNVTRLKEEGLDKSPLLNLERNGGGGGGEQHEPAVVYKVVVKQLKDPKSCGDVKAHFREVAIERRLRHPSIVPYIASCSLAPQYASRLFF
jgi:hypothetical protein